MATSNVTRRSLVKGAALGAASLGVAAGAGAALADEAAGYKDPSSWVKATQNVEWDEEHDIVVVGYGMAGTTAYVEAVEIDPNVDIVIYDSSDEENAGGQAVASGQCVIFPEPNDIETFRTYMHAMNEPRITFYPDPKNVAFYAEQYEKYKKLYKAQKEILGIE